MIHEGQEFARSKVIAPTTSPDPDVGKIDHNSYEKENETNWLNYHHRDLNRELYDYYRGLIALRKQYPQFCNAPKDSIEFFKTEDDFFIAYQIKPLSNTMSMRKKTPSSPSFIVLLNGNPKQEAKSKLPRGVWEVLANETSVSPNQSLGNATVMATVRPTSGMILMRLK